MERIDDISVFGQSSKPLVTVVTVVFNGGGFLEETIQSVICQTYDAVEYIVIDGGSTDDTLNIIEKYDDHIDFWISECDKGIYDAMNKGVLYAKGVWIVFMNSGDSFYSADSLASVFEGGTISEDILFGDVDIRYPDFSRIERAGDPKNLWRGMQFSHQSVFVRTELLKKKNFNFKNLIAADLEFLYWAFKNNFEFRRVDHVVSSVRTGGLSESNRLKTIIACKDAVCATDSSVGIKIFYVFRLFDLFLRSCLKIILPKTVVNLIIRGKN